MTAFFEESVFSGVLLSLLAYGAGCLLKRKTGLAIANPLLISIILVIAFLLAFHIDYPTYQKGANYISYLLTPATVCLAIPLHRQFALLKKKLDSHCGRHRLRRLCQSDECHHPCLALPFQP